MQESSFIKKSIQVVFVILLIFNVLQELYCKANTTYRDPGLIFIGDSISPGAQTKGDPGLYINPRFGTISVKAGVPFADVIDYKARPVKLLMDIYQPEGDTSQRRPVIIWIHGGGFRTGSTRTQSYIVKLCQDFAKRGYVCLSVDYRLREGADMPDKASEFPALQDGARDVNYAIEWVRAQYRQWKIDPDCIFLAGGSAGGRISMTVCQFPGPDPAARNLPESLFRTKPWNKMGIIANACLWGGIEPEMRGWVYPYLRKDGVPSILIHGDADKTIPVQNSIDLDKALKNAGITSELHIIPGAAHTPTGNATYPEIVDWISKFFANEWQKVQRHNAMGYNGRAEPEWEAKEQ